MTTVTIYNADHQVLGHCDIKHAIGMLVRKVAEPYQWLEDRDYGAFPFVTAVILTAAKYVYPKWLDGPAPFSCEALRRRDNYTCRYCDRPGNEVEHIVPKSRGGSLSWENCVVACRECNGRKDNRTPEEAGMRLLSQPWTPTRRDVSSWKVGRRRRR